MERTDYVAKAKELMKKTARTAALVIVPLSAAVSAHATTISGATLPTQNFSCSTGGSASGATADCSSGAGIFQLPGNTGITGASFFTFSPVFVGASGSGSADIEMWAGTNSFLGPLTQNVPLAIDFNIEAFSGGTISDWSFIIVLGSSPEDNTYGQFDMSGSGASGSFTASIPINGTVPSGVPFYETWELSANYQNVVAGVEFDVPGAASVDLQSAAASGVPEPGTIGLIGAGLALLGGIFRRRKRA